MATADPLLVVGLTLLLIVMLVINFYILVYWQHPDDKNESILVRVLIVYGLQLSAVAVLMLPVDVANNAGDPSCDPTSLFNQGTSTYCGGIDMFAVWETFFSMICFSVVCFIPLAMFYYEADSFDLNNANKKKTRLIPALMQESVVIVFFLVLLLALYYTKSYTALPVDEYKIDYTVGVTSTSNITTSGLSRLLNYTRLPGQSPYEFVDLNIPLPQNVTATEALVVMPAPFSVYLIGLFSWLAWWMFTFFVGVGFACTPVDFIAAYVFRPRVMAPDAMANKELELQDKTSDLIEIVTLLKRERANLNDGGAASKRALRVRYLPDRMEVNRLTQMVFLLERDLQDFKSCKDVRKGYNPLVPYFYLAAGIFFCLLTVLWLLQIILSVITTPPASPFLSLYLISFDSWFPMFGNLTYAIFALYLLLCTIKGCFKLSVRFVCCKLYPMQPSGTFINAFVFNLGIIMTSSVPLVHFCVVAFGGYTVYSDVFFLFAVQVKNLNFFSSFFQNNVFIWMLMMIAFVSMPYFIYRPRDIAMSAEDVRRNLADRAMNSGGNYSIISKKGDDKKEVELTKV
ncbi:hypothetical protein EON65_20435 [archaeon]|nr:MAG: hypothetical protein EON65_20435 [archaeon]